MRCSNPHRLEQHAGGQQGGLAIVVFVDVVSAVIRDRDEQRILAGSRKAPGLRVVATGRPTREVQDLLDLGRVGRQVAGLRLGQSQRGGDTPFDDFQLQPLERMVIAERKPSPDEASKVNVELVVVRGGTHRAAAKEDLDGLGTDDSGTELDRRRGRWAALLREIEAARIDQIGAVQSHWRQPEQEARILRFQGPPLHSEILFKGHPSGKKDDVAGAKADRPRGYGRDLQLAAAPEDLGSNLRHEEVEPVDKQVDAVQEGIDVVVADALVKAVDVERRIDVARHLSHDVGFRPTEAR